MSDLHKYPVLPMHQLLSFLHVTERLKEILRHSWLSDGRQESVAEHSWRVACIALLVTPLLDQPVDLSRCLQMALIHDLAEAETGDIPVFANSSAEGKRAKYEQEYAAMRRITDLLDHPIGQDLFALWEEYERQESYEARVVRAIDKLEAQLQHNEADLSTWLPQEKQMVFQPQWTHAFCAFDGTLTQFSDEVRAEARAKLATQDSPIQTFQQEEETAEKKEHDQQR